MIRLESCGLSIYLTPDSAELLVLLARILTPGIAITTCAEKSQGELLISVLIDPDLKKWSNFSNMPQYVVDKGKIEFSLEDIRRDSAVFVKHADEGADPIRLSAAGTENWSISIANQSPNNLRGLVRLIRYIFGNMLFRSGVLFLHASAVSLRGAAFLFAGPAGSGKSSLMFKCCSELAGEFISDDLVCIWRRTDGAIMVSGWPKRVAIGTNLIKPGSYLQRCVEQAESSERRYYLDEGRSDQWSVEGRSRIRFDSGEFLDSFGFRECRAAPARAIVLPTADPKIHRWYTRRLSAESPMLNGIINGDSSHIRHITDILGLFKGLPSIYLEPLILDFPMVEVRYGSEINVDFLSFWRDIETQVEL